MKELKESFIFLFVIFGIAFVLLFYPMYLLFDRFYFKEFRKTTTFPKGELLGTVGIVGWLIGVIFVPSPLGYIVAFFCIILYAIGQHVLWG